MSCELEKMLDDYIVDNVGSNHLVYTSMNGESVVGCLKVDT